MEKFKPIKVVINGLDNCKVFMIDFILLKAFFDFGNNKIREIELLVPYRRFIFAVRTLPVPIQKQMIDTPMELELTKLDRNRIELNNVKVWSGE